MLFLILKGGIIGLALAIPGVSAGTLAFITGLYSRLISFISSILPFLLKRKWKLLWSSMLPLLPVFSGMIFSFLLAAWWIVLLIEQFPVLSYSFLSGIILMSVAYLFRHMKFSAMNFIIFFVSAVFSFGLSFFQELFFDGFFWFFISVYFSVLAMLLPGVSGSYILVLTGTYSRFLTAFHTFSLDLLVIFFALVISLVSGSQFIQYLLQNKKERMMAFLTGLTLGGGVGIFPLKTQIQFTEKGVLSFISFALAVFLVGFSLKFVSYWDTLRKK